MHWGQIVALARRTRRWQDKVRLWVAPPGWRPDDLPPVEVPEVSPQRPKFETRTSRALDIYVGANFAVVALAVTGFLMLQDTLPPQQLAAYGALIVAAVIAWGGMMQSRPWAGPLEAARLALTVPVVGWLTAPTPHAVWATAAAAVLCAATGLWLALVRRAPVAVPLTDAS